MVQIKYHQGMNLFVSIIIHEKCYWIKWRREYIAKWIIRTWQLDKCQGWLTQTLRGTKETVDKARLQQPLCDQGEKKRRREIIWGHFLLAQQEDHKEKRRRWESKKFTVRNAGFDPATSGLWDLRSSDWANPARMTMSSFMLIQILDGWTLRKVAHTGHHLTYYFYLC